MVNQRTFGAVMKIWQIMFVVFIALFGAVLPGQTAECHPLCKVHYGLNWQEADKQEVAEWLAGGGNLHRQSDEASFPLAEAAYFGNVQAAKALLAAGAPVNIRDARDRNILYYALDGMKNNPVMPVLLRAGADVNDADGEGRAALYHAFNTGQEGAIIAALLAAGAEVNRANNEGTTPLHLATWYNRNAPVVAMLMDAGADVRAKDGGGRIPLHFAAWHDENQPVVLLLLTAGAAVNAKDAVGQTPLHYAASSNIGNALIRVLLDADAALNPRDKDGKTPLYYAARSANKPTFFALLQAGAGVETAQDGGGIMHAAAMGDSPDIVRAARKFSPINGKDKRGDTPAHYWARRGDNPMTLDVLLDFGADINAKNKNQRTPLHEAVLRRNQQTITALLQRQADVCARDKKGLTPLALAEGGLLDEVEDAEILSLLRAAQCRRD